MCHWLLKICFLKYDTKQWVALVIFHVGYTSLSYTMYDAFDTLNIAIFITYRLGYNLRPKLSLPPSLFVFVCAHTLSFELRPSLSCSQDFPIPNPLPPAPPPTKNNFKKNSLTVTQVSLAHSTHFGQWSILLLNFQKRHTLINWFIFNYMTYVCIWEQ